MDYSYIKLVLYISFYISSLGKMVLHRYKDNTTIDIIPFRRNVQVQESYYFSCVPYIKWEFNCVASLMQFKYNPQLQWAGEVMQRMASGIISRFLTSNHKTGITGEKAHLLDPTIRSSLADRTCNILLLISCDGQM